MKIYWKALLPVIVTLVLALIPAPAGCPQHAWYYFAIFAGVITALITEPLPIAAVGIVAVTIVAVLAPWVLFSPQQLAAPKFNAANASLNWALSGFSNSSVWLIFGAFMFALGYQKTGLGPRITFALVKAMGRKTLFLGYAIMFTDLILSPFVPSTTARSGGTIYPIVRNIPELYGSKPNDPSFRRIGNYIMWMTLVATCATSSMFVTALSSNLLAVSFVQKTANLQLTWGQWFAGHLPVTILMLLFLPVLIYWLYPPEVKEGEAVPKWAGEQLAKLGPLSARELMFGAMVSVALILWICATNYINTTTVALLVIALMLMTRVVTWNDMLGNSAAWNVLVWFATLIPMADGLARVGFVKWFAESIAGHVVGFSPTSTMIVLVLVFYFSHYMFASVTAHVTALVPVLVTVAMAIPGMNMLHFSLLMCYMLGTMGVITPYATGPSPLIAGSGYVPTGDYWRLGAITGLIIMAIQFIILIPWLNFWFPS